MPYVDYDPFGAPTGRYVDYDPFAEAEEPERVGSGIIDLGGAALRGLAEGVTTEIPSMVGGAAQFLGSKTGIESLEEGGRGIKEWAEEKSTDWFGEQPERSGLNRIFYEGSKMLGPSVIPAGAITAGFRGVLRVGKLAGAAKKAKAIANATGKAEDIAKATQLTAQASKAANTALSAGSATNAVALFGMSQAQNTIDNAERTAKELEAKGDIAGAAKAREAAQGYAPYLTGAIEAAGEYFGTKYLGKLFGLDESEVLKLGPREIAKRLGKTLGVEVGTEVGQAGGQATVEKVSGARPEADPLAEAFDVIGPTAFMTLITGGLAAGAQSIGQKEQPEPTPPKVEEVPEPVSPVQPEPIIQKPVESVVPIQEPTFYERNQGIIEQSMSDEELESLNELRRQTGMARPATVVTEPIQQRARGIIESATVDDAIRSFEDTVRSAVVSGRAAPFSPEIAATQRRAETLALPPGQGFTLAGEYERWEPPTPVDFEQIAKQAGIVEAPPTEKRVYAPTPTPVDWEREAKKAGVYEEPPKVEQPWLDMGRKRGLTEEDIYPKIFRTERAANESMRQRKIDGVVAPVEGGFKIQEAPVEEVREDTGTPVEGGLEAGRGEETGVEDLREAEAQDEAVSGGAEVSREEVGPLRYDPSVDQHNGEKLTRGDVLTDDEGNRYALDRDSGFMLTLTEIDEGGKPKGIKSFSVDPTDTDRFRNLYKVGGNIYQPAPPEGTTAPADLPSVGAVTAPSEQAAVPAPTTEESSLVAPEAPVDQTGNGEAVAKEQSNIDAMPPAAKEGKPVSMGYIQAKKRPDGKWQLFYRGTRNEVFPGEMFNSNAEAKNYYKAIWAKAAAEAPVVQTSNGGTDDLYRKIENAVNKADDPIITRLYRNTAMDPDAEYTPGITNRDALAKVLAGHGISKDDVEAWANQTIEDATAGEREKLSTPIGILSQQSKAASQSFDNLTEEDIATLEAAIAAGVVSKETRNGKTYYKRTGDVDSWLAAQEPPVGEPQAPLSGTGETQKQQPPNAPETDFGDKGQVDEKVGEGRNPEQAETSVRVAEQNKREAEFAKDSAIQKILLAPKDEKQAIAQEMSKEHAQALIERLDAAPGDDIDARKAVYGVYPELKEQPAFKRGTEEPKFSRSSNLAYKKGDKIYYIGDERRGASTGVIDSKWSKNQYMINLDSGQKIVADIKLLKTVEKKKFKRISRQENKRRVKKYIEDNLAKLKNIGYREAKEGETFLRAVWEPVGDGKLQPNELDDVSLPKGENVQAIHVTNEPENWAEILQDDYARDENYRVIEIEAMPGDIVVEDIQQTMPTDRFGRMLDSGILVTGRDLLNRKKDGVYFKRGEQSPGLPKQEVVAITKKVSENWKGAPDFAIHSTQETLPDQIQAMMGDGDIVKGVLYDGMVHLVAPNLATEQDVIEAIAHETFGHYGLKGLGERGRMFAYQVYGAKKSAIADILKEPGYGFDVSTREGKIQAADEWLAREAQANPESTWVDRAIRLVKGFIRKLGFDVKLSDAEIRAWIADMRHVVVEGKAQAVRWGDARFMVAFHGTRHILKPEPGYPHGRFRLEFVGTGEGGAAYGFGIYFAEEEETGKAYMTAGAEATMDGVSARDWLNSQPDSFYAIIREAKSKGENITVQEAADKYEKEVKHYRSAVSAAVTYGVDNAERMLRYEKNDGAIPVLKELIDSGRLKPPEGNIYTLDIPADVIPKLLDWDREVSSNRYVLSAIENSSLFKDGPDGILRDVKHLGDFINTNTFAEKGLASLNTPSGLKMLGSMFTVAQNREVFDSIVKLIPVDMMDNLVSAKLSPEVLFHNQSVFIDFFTGKSNPPVPLGRNVAPSLIGIMTSETAKWGASDLGRASLKNLAALGTLDVGHMTGSSLYRKLSDRLGQYNNNRGISQDRAASEYLASIGIPGNIHGGISQGATGAKYVIWDQDVLDRIALLERNGEKLDAIREQQEEEARFSKSGPTFKAVDTESEEFKRWFGRSKVVDQDENPRVVYHGSPQKQLTEFQLNKGQNAGDAVLGEGFYFTTNKDRAETYAHDFTTGESGSVVEAYTVLENPYIIGFEEHDTLVDEAFGPYPESLSPQEKTKRLKQLGFDGVVQSSDPASVSEDGIIPDDVEAEIVVFEPTQIKSAISNTGDFSSTNPDIQFMRGEGETSGYTEGRSQIDKAREALTPIFDKTLYWIVDKNRPISLVQKKLGETREDLDLFLRETQRPKITAAKVKEAWDTRVVPMLEKMAEHKLRIEDLEAYSHALHAPERNKAMREARAKMYLDAVLGSVKAKESKALRDEISELQEKRKEQVKEWIKRGSVDPGYRAGIFPKENLKLLNKAFEEFADNEKVQKLKKEWDSFADRLSGMTNKEAAEILKEYEGNEAIREVHRMLSAINDEKLEILREAGVLPEEEYQAIKAKYEHYVPLHREGFDDSIGGTGRGLLPAGRGIKTAAGSTRNVVNIVANTISNFEAAIDRAEKAESSRVFLNLLQENPSPEILTIEPQKKEPRHDKYGNLRMYPDTFSVGNDEIRIMVDGRQYLIKAHDADAKYMLRTLKAEDAQHGPILNALAKLNRWLARVNTSWSPEFVLSNFVRDIQTAGVNIGDTGVDSKKMFRGALQSIKAIYAVERNKRKGGELEALYDRFKKAGGKIGWSDVHGSVEKLAGKVSKELDLLSGKRPKEKIVRDWFRWVDDANTSVENGIRLHVFKLATEQGMSDRKAAQIASDITVDFTKKGAAGPVINSLYLFANAGIQGSYRIIRAGAKSKKVQKMMGGIVAAGFLSGLMNSMAGEDDDGEDYFNKLDPFVLERNAVFMLPGTKGKHVKIPLPWGYNFFWNTGVELSRAFTKEDYSVISSAGRLAGVFAGAFNPIASGTLLQTLAPTIADPFVQVAENKNWFGGDLMPQQNIFDKTPTPDSQRYWKSAGVGAKWVANQINSLTGGSKIRPGAIDISPETLDLMLDTVGGSALRVFKDAFEIPYKLVAEEETQLHEIPFLRRVVGEQNEWVDARLYSENVRDVLMVTEEMKAYKGTLYADKVRKNSGNLLRLSDYTKQTESYLRKLRKSRNSAEVVGDKKKVEQINNKIKEVQKRFNRKFNEAQ